MSDQKRYLAVIHRVGDGKCVFSGKQSAGAVVTMQNRSIVEGHLSWQMLRKLLQFQEQAHVNTQSTNAKPQPES